MGFIFLGGERVRGKRVWGRGVVLLIERKSGVGLNFRGFSNGRDIFVGVSLPIMV